MTCRMFANKVNSRLETHVFQVYIKSMQATKAGKYAHKSSEDRQSSHSGCDLDYTIFSENRRTFSRFLKPNDKFLIKYPQVSKV